MKVTLSGRSNRTGRFFLKNVMAMRRRAKVSHIPHAVRLTPSNGETTFLKARNYEIRHEKLCFAENGVYLSPTCGNKKVPMTSRTSGPIP